MEVLFGTENSFLYLLGCIIVSSGITLIIYYRNKELYELKKWQVRILSALRFFTVLVLSVLLLSPLLKTLKRYINQPVIITAFDNSASMTSYTDSTKARLHIDSLYKEIQGKLSGNFRTVNYTFGEEAKTGETPEYTEKKSDYSKLINTVYNNHFNENVGALILVGDGIYNIGANPAAEAQKLGFPVYSVGIGDTSTVKDAAITEIHVNRNAFLGNQFPVELGLKFEMMANQPAILEVVKNGSIVYNRRIVPKNDDYFVSETFNLNAEEPGLEHYSIQLNVQSREQNMRNNRSQFAINVIENKQKVLIISEGPHPDIGAIKDILEEQQNFEISVFTREPYPDNFSEFNLIILNQIPSSGTAAGSLVTLSLESKTPLLFIVGGKTFIPQFNQLNLGVEIIPQARNPEEAQPVFNNNFERYTVSEELREMTERFPPLMVPFAEIKNDPAYSALLYQNLNNIKTQRPLVLLGNIEGRKTGVIFGEGIWRWRLYNYYFNESHKQFSEFIVSMIQYLSLRENEDNFIVDYKPVYYDTDPVILNAEVYNELFEQINGPEVNIELINENGDSFPFLFDNDGKYYRLNAGKLPVGNYSFSANVQIGGEEFTESGAFAVLPLQIENIETKANFNVMYRIAEVSGGEFFYEKDLGQLEQLIQNNNQIKPVSYFQASLTELLNQKWLFLVLLLFAGVEWFLRKFWGIY